MINVNIVGGSGYAGGELLRILLQHPKTKIHQVTSQRFTNQPASLVHPNLRDQTDITFCSLEELKPCDLMFVALPNGQSMSLMKNFMKLANKIIDLGADFRLQSAKVFKSWYGVKHKNSSLCGKFTYGLAELHRQKIKQANYIACGGCEATAIILALYPLVKQKLIQNQVIADIKIASSASGSKATSASHHPERHGVLRSYKPTNHRHQAEVDQELGLHTQISATSVNLVRGILATIHTRVNKSLTEKDIWQAYRKVYATEPFIRLVKQSQGLYRYPEPKLLWGTNYCDIGFELDNKTGRLVVISAIDNLVKGTAGQAIQAMNIMHGFSETTALEFTGLHPI